MPLVSASREGGTGDRQTERLLSSLLLPLPSTSAAFSSSSSNSNEDIVIGLLRVPSERRGLQVVSCSRGAPAMELLARSTDELLIRLLAEEEAAASSGSDSSSKKARPLAAAAGPAADGLLSSALLAAAAKAAAEAEEEKRASGEEKTSSMSRGTLDRALVAAAALSPALCERLLASHLERRDEMSALITGEWYMRRNHFPGWARPYEHVSRVYSSLGRTEEARDFSRVALSLPWWTLGSGLEAAAKLAGLPRDGAGARQAAERGAGGLPPVTNRDERQRTLDAFAAVLDDGAASASSASAGGGGEGDRCRNGDVDWPAFAERGASVLEEGGAFGRELIGLAAFVRGGAL